MIIVQQIVLSLLDKQNSGTYLYKEDSQSQREKGSPLLLTVILMWANLFKLQALRK